MSATKLITKTARRELTALVVRHGHPKSKVIDLYRELRATHAHRDAIEQIDMHFAAGATAAGTGSATPVLRGAGGARRGGRARGSG